MNAGARMHILKDAQVKISIDLECLFSQYLVTFPIFTQYYNPESNDYIDICNADMVIWIKSRQHTIVWIKINTKVALNFVDTCTRVHAG